MIRVTTLKLIKVSKGLCYIQWNREYYIGSELMGCIKWRTTIGNVSKDVYYTLWQENRYPMTRYISEDVQCRDMVVKRFAEIISAVYNVEVSPDYQTVIIPVRTEYDENGKPVHSLEGCIFRGGS